MGQTVIHVGKIVEVVIPDDSSIDLVAKNILITEYKYKEKRIKQLEREYNNKFLSCLIEEYYDDFLYIKSKNKLYRIIGAEIPYDQDMYNIEENEDGSMEYFVKFNDGGMTLEDALKTAITNKK